MSYIRRYLDDVNNVLQQLPVEQVAAIIRRLQQARDEGRAVFIIGNGGSAATATHFANDLMKGAQTPGHPPIKAISLTDNAAVIMAYANDCGYETVFTAQLEALAAPGDLLVAFSGSGRSPNVISALETARQREMYVIGITGRDGGLMPPLCDLCLIAPCQEMAQIEDAHMVLTHLIYTAIHYEAEL